MPEYLQRIGEFPLADGQSIHFVWEFDHANGREDTKIIRNAWAWLQDGHGNWEAWSWNLHAGNYQVDPLHPIPWLRRHRIQEAMMRLSTWWNGTTPKST